MNRLHKAKPRMLVGAMALLVGLSGCATSMDPPQTSPVVTSVSKAGVRVGEVVLVRPHERYVIVRGEPLPKDGEEARVFRDDVVVGSVRFTGPRRAPFIAADIVQGIIQSGDRVIR